eukprot:7377848-Prymnesium_polylepis.1
MLRGVGRVVAGVLLASGHCSITHGATGLTPPLRMLESAIQPGARRTCGGVRDVSRGARPRRDAPETPQTQNTKRVAPDEERDNGHCQTRSLSRSPPPRTPVPHGMQSRACTRAMPLPTRWWRPPTRSAQVHVRAQLPAHTRLELTHHRAY